MSRSWPKGGRCLRAWNPNPRGNRAVATGSSRWRTCSRCLAIANPRRGRRRRWRRTRHRLTEGPGWWPNSRSSLSSGHRWPGASMPRRPRSRSSATRPRRRRTSGSLSPCLRGCSAIIRQWTTIGAGLPWRPRAWGRCSRGPTVSLRRGCTSVGPWRFSLMLNACEPGSPGSSRRPLRHRRRSTLLDAATADRFAIDR